MVTRTFSKTVSELMPNTPLSQAMSGNDQGSLKDFPPSAYTPSESNQLNSSTAEAKRENLMCESHNKLLLNFKAKLSDDYLDKMNGIKTRML